MPSLRLEVSMARARLKRAVMSGGTALLCVLGTGAWVHARQAGPPANEAVLPALLTEVRGLRAAMEQMASAGPRVQLFASRLQMQETRVNNLSKRLSDVRDTLAASQQGLVSMQGQQQQIEAALTEHQAGLTPES